MILQTKQNFSHSLLNQTIWNYTKKFKKKEKGTSWGWAKQSLRGPIKKTPRVRTLGGGRWKCHCWVKIVITGRNKVIAVITQFQKFNKKKASESHQGGLKGSDNVRTLAGFFYDGTLKRFEILEWSKCYMKVFSRFPFYNEMFNIWPHRNTTWEEDNFAGRQPLKKDFKLNAKEIVHYWLFVVILV